MVSGYEIPNGYQAAEEAARRAGHSFEVFKRMCRQGRVPGAYRLGGPGRGLWIVPEDFRILSPPERPRVGEERGREIARRARAGENKTSLAREYGIWRSHVYNLMERYPDEGSPPSGAGPRLFEGHVIPPGHEPVEDAAQRRGHNVEVFKRMCRDDRVPGAHKTRGPGRGLWVVPEGFTILPADERPRIGEKRGREVARRAYAGENRTGLAREYGINRRTVYDLMKRYPGEGPGP